RPDPAQHTTQQRPEQSAGRDGKRKTGKADRRPDRVDSDERDSEKPDAVRLTNPVQMLDRVSVVEPSQSVTDIRSNEEHDGEPGNSNCRGLRSRSWYSRGSCAWLDHGPTQFMSRAFALSGRTCSARDVHNCATVARTRYGHRTSRGEHERHRATVLQ